MVHVTRNLPVAMSLLLHATLTSLVCLFAVCLTIDKLLSFQFALAAAAADAINLLSFSCALVWVLRRPDYPRKKCVDQAKGFFAFIVTPAIAYAATLLFLVMMQFEVHSSAAQRVISKMMIGRDIYYLLDACWGILATSLLASVIMVVSFRKDEPHVVNQEQQLPRYTIARISPTWSPPSPLSFHEVGISIPPLSPCLGPIRQTDSSSETPEPLPSAARKSAIRPVTSRTRLASRSSPSESDLADDYSPESRFCGLNTPLSSPISSHGYLESRPRPAINTMANWPLGNIPDKGKNTGEKSSGWPFHGNFSGCNESASTACSSPASPSSPFPGNVADAGHLTTSASDEGDSSPTPPSRTALSEKHIHPLFRSDSPLPPPATTPSSSVTAAAFGGKYITSNALARVRARSVPSSAKAIALQTLPQSSTGNSKAVPTAPVMIRSKSVEATKSIGAVIEGNENIPPVPPLPSSLCDASDWATSS